MGEGWADDDDDDDDDMMMMMMMMPWVVGNDNKETIGKPLWLHSVANE